MALTTGTRLGPYEIISPLGAGGMGEVYRARDTKLKRDVAVKVLPAAFAQDVERIARFEREAIALAALHHPHIASLFGMEQADGQHYLVMELVEGETLADRIARGAMPLEEALPIARQIADALEAAHEKGIVHRDLKPGNVMVMPDGVVKVLDFGLAKALDSGQLVDASAASISRSPTLTAASLPGVILGTAAYMAPEQARGKTVDKRADIWAFGALLYEMLVGVCPFDGETVSDVLALVITREPNLELVPAGARTLVAACLTKDPKQRLRDIGDGWRLLESHATTSGDKPRATVRALVWPSATLCLLALLVLVSYRHFGEAVPESRLVTSSLVAPEGTRYDFYSLGPPALSPDGRSIAFSARSPRGIELWVRRLDSSTARALPGTEQAIYPFWSADGKSLGFGARGQLKKVDLAGGNAVGIATLPAPLRGGSWGPSEDIVFGVSGNGRPLFRVSASGGSPVPITVTERDGKPAGRRLPWFLPDGRHFLYSVTWGVGESCICVGALDQPEAPEQPIVTTASQGNYADGYLFYYRDDTLLAQRFDAARLTTTGDPQPIEPFIATTGFPRAGVFSAATGGMLVYQIGSQTSGQERLTWLDRAGRPMGSVGESASFGNIELSPDGTRLVASLSNRANGTDLWIYDLSRGVPSRFTTDNASDQAVWSADGKSIIWRSGRLGPPALFRKASNFSGPDELVYASPLSKRPTSLSHDGRFLLFNDVPTDNADLWLLPLTKSADGKPQEARQFLQTGAGEGLGRFSPDGAWVAYQSNESGVLEIYATPFPGPGGKVQISNGGGTQPRWRRDGKEIFFVTTSGEIMAAEVTLGHDDVRVGRTERLFGNVTIDRGYLWDVSADGKKFIVVVDENRLTAPPLTLVQNWLGLPAR